MTGKNVKNKNVKNKNVKKETIKPSTEDLILGVQEEVQEVEIVDYTSIDIRYDVKIRENGRTVNVNGREIGTFLGQNQKARRELEQGKSKVKVLDSKGNELYLIEVV